MAEQVMAPRAAQRRSHKLSNKSPNICGMVIAPLALIGLANSKPSKQKPPVHPNT